MEHVSTLCAISTVGVAATGLAFGRVDQTSSKFGRFRRKTLPRHDPSVVDTNAITPGEPPKSSGTPATNSSPGPEHCDAGKQGALNGVPLEIDPTPRRRSSLFTPVRLRFRDETFTNPPASVAEKKSHFSHVRRPSSSWLRQISTASNLGGGSRVASPSPLSPNFNGPASPALSRPPSQRRAPNKLVKRPPSVQSNVRPLLGRSSSSTAASPTFRRPATSHQRTKTPHQKASHSLNFEPGFSVPPTMVETPEPPHKDSTALRPYLVSFVDKLPERLVRRLSAVATPRENGLRRILPNASAVPALVPATSIATERSKTKAARDLCTTPTTPTTPATPTSPSVQFRDPFNSIDASATWPETPFPPERSNHRPSVSFDETDFKAQVQNSTGTGTERPRANSLTYTKRRAASTPLPGLPRSEKINPESLLPHERRNITDPNGFCRSPSGIIKKSPRSILPSSVSRDFRAEMIFSPSQNASSRPFESKDSSTSAGRQRPRRHSVAASDPASTVIGSDDTRVFTSSEEDDTDFLSETCFDSVRTHLTKSSNSAPHGPRIETIFDKVPSMGLPSEGLTKLEDFIPRGSFLSQPPTIDPYASGIDKLPTPDSSHIPHMVPGSREGESSRLSLLSDITDDEDVRSLVAGLPGEPGGPLFPSTRLSSLLPDEIGSAAPLHSRDVFEIRNDASLLSTPYGTHNASKETLEPAPKMNIFDWSEQPRSDREVSGSDARPRTVHGKQGPESRASRAPGRKAPTTLHLRSSSVPVSRDPSLSSDSRQSSGKFGTWGLGSKGVSEDWDNDFDFEDEDDDTGGEEAKPSKMAVPKAIMDRQASLHGQFGQVQELTLLVEELKRLRHQASLLGLVHGPSSGLWREAEGIVNLATVDEDDNNQSPPRSPSSLTFSFDDSEEESSYPIDRSKRTSGDSWPASISEVSVSDNKNPSSDRSCKESSSAKAKSVLDLIYQQRSSTYDESPNPRPKKLPFDTQSLHDLVVRAGVVTRALKEVIRKAEGVTTTPKKGIVPSDPPFSRIFNQPSEDDDPFANFEEHPLR